MVVLLCAMPSCGLLTFLIIKTTIPHVQPPSVPMSSSKPKNVRITLDPDTTPVSPPSSPVVSSLFSNNNASGSSWRVEGSTLIIGGPDGSDWHRLPLDDKRKLLLPSSVTHVSIEIGARYFSEFFHAITNESGLFVVAIEANPTSFTRMRRTVEKMDAFLQQRTLLLNVAIGPAPRLGPFATLHVGDWMAGGCSSLLKGSARHTRLVDCAMGNRRNVTVPLLPLSVLLDLFLAGGFVRNLKVDAQGLDLPILESAGARLAASTIAVMAEVQNVPHDSALLLYEEQPNKADMVAFMAAQGFALERCFPQNRALREENCIFCNRRGGLLHSAAVEAARRRGPHMRGIKC